MSDIGIKLTADASGLQQGLNQAANAVQNFGRSSGDSLKQFGADAAGVQGSIDSLANGLKSAFIGSSVAVGLIGLKNTLGEVRQELIQTQIQADKMRNGLSFAVGSGNAPAEMEFLRTNARDLGQELVSTTAMYTKLAAAARGTALAGQGARDVFTALSQASTVMGLSAQETEGALLAVTQMISKGKVQAEELRGQLGERLPGAFQIAARAMGVTTAELDKMLETGQVLAEDFLPKFAAELSRNVAPQVEEASKSMQASVNRLANAGTELKRAINDMGAADLLKSMADGSANFLSGIVDQIRQIKEQGGGGFAQMATGLGAVISRALQLQRLDISLQTHPEQVATLTDRLKEAEAELASLQSTTSKDPGNILIRGAIKDTQDYIAELRKARAEQMALMGDQSGNNAENARLGRSASQFAADAARSKKMQADLAKVRGELSPGLDKDYLQNLNTLQSAREAGVDKGGVSETEYVRLVSDLAKKNYKAPEVKKDHNLDAMSGKLQAAKERLEVAKAQSDSTDKLTESEKAYNKLQADSTEGFSRAALAQRKKTLTTLEEAAALEKVNRQRDEDAKALASYSRVADAAIGKLREEADTYNLTGVALQKITATRALDKAAADAMFDTRVNERGEEEKYLKVSEGRAAKILLQADADKQAVRVLVEKVAAQKEIIKNDEQIARLKTDSTVYLDASTKAIALLDQERDKRRKNLEAYKEDTAERRRLVEQDAELYQQGLDNIRADKLREVWQSVDQIAHQTFTNIFEGGQDVFTKLRDTLKATLLDLLYQMTVRKWIFNITAAVTGSGSMMNSTQQSIFGGGPGGSALGDVANGASIYNTVSGGMAGVGASVSTVGNFVGSANIASYGAGMGMSGSAAVNASAAYLEASTEALIAGNTTLAATYEGVATSLTAGATTTSSLSSTLGAIPGWGWVALALSTQLGGPQIDKIGDGVAGTLSTSGSSVQKVTDYKEDHHGLFGIGAYTTHNREYSAADASVSNYIDSAVMAVTQSTKGYAAAIGLSADAVDGFTKEIDISLTGLNPEQQKAAIDKAIGSFTDDMVTSAYGTSLAAFAKTGETSSATLQRVAVELTTVNSVFDSMGHSLMAVSLSGATASDALVNLMGGLDAFKAQTAAYYQNFYTPAEQKANTVKQINTALTGTGFDAATATRADFRKLVDAQDLTTESGRKMFATLMSVQGAFAGITDAGDDVTQSLEKAATARKEAANAAYSSLVASINAEKTRATLVRDLAKEQVSAIKGVFDTLKSNVSALYGSVDSTATMQAQQGSDFITKALAAAQTTGYLPDQTQLADAISGARGGVDSAIYASQKDADFARLELAGRLDQLKIISGSQLSDSQRALRIAQDQLDALGTLADSAKAQLDAALGLNTMVRSLGEAMGYFEKAVSDLGAGNSATASTAGEVSFGGGSSHTSGVDPKYSQKFNVAGFGIVSNFITDPNEIARLDSINAYINTVGVASQDDIRTIYKTALQYGVSQQDIANATGYLLGDINKLFAGAGVPAFASGGAHSGGWALVGEQGPELAYMPPARIYNAADTAAMMGSGGNTARLEALVEALTLEVQRLQERVDTTNEHASRTANAVEGNQSRPLLVEIAV